MLDREFHLKPSRYYVCFIAATLLVSLGIIVNLPCAPVMKLIGLLSVILYGAKISWQFVLLRSATAITRIKSNGANEWQLCTREKRVEATLSGDSTVTPFVSILRFRVPGEWRARSCIIFKDSLASAHYRELMVVLRMSV